MTDANSVLISPTISHVIADVGETVCDFMSRYPVLETAAGAVGQCAIRTHELVEKLIADGYGAEIVWVRGHAVPVPVAHQRASWADAHALVRLADGSFVDVTRRQFDPGACLPATYASEQGLSRDWLEINDDPERHAPWRPLRGLGPTEAMGPT